MKNNAHESLSLDAQELKKRLLNSLLVMAWAVEARDPYTGGHLWRVSQCSRAVAAALNFSTRETARLAIGAFLHDLGKIGVPDHILGKKDKLTDAEFEVIKTHPAVGWKILSGHPLASMVEHAIRLHHEMPNGGGYPLGLKGEAIPLHARIVGVCDAFDAMTSTRPYRSGMPIEKALTIIERNLGSQFDAAVGSVFVSLGRKGQFDHIVSHSDEGIPLHNCAMCGPIISIRRETQAGDHVNCPACAAEYVVKEDAQGKKITQPTGKQASADTMAISVDNNLIDRFVTANATGIDTV